MRKIRVAILGVGNCASSLVQGVTYYSRAIGNSSVPGLMHVELGGYTVGDVEFVAAFDVASSKVGRDVADAILSDPNNTRVFTCVPKTGVIVQRGPTMDGLGHYLRQLVDESDAEAVNVAEVLRRTEAEVLISYLPVG